MKHLRDILTCCLLLVCIALGVQAIAFLSAAQATLGSVQQVAASLSPQVDAQGVRF